MIQKMSYSNDEKETILRFDYVNQIWYAESTVPSHITKLLKVGGEIEILTAHDSGKPSCVKATLAKPQISFRSPRRTQENEEEILPEGYCTREGE